MLVGDYMKKNKQQQDNIQSPYLHMDIAPLDILLDDSQRPYLIVIMNQFRQIVDFRIDYEEPKILKSGISKHKKGQP